MDSTVVTAIDPERLALYQSKVIGHGAHPHPNGVGCAMELASWLAGEPWSDHPRCVSPTIGAFMRTWNDSLPSDAERDRLTRDLVPLTLGTATTAADESKRAWMALDWLVRVQAPAWLRQAGLGEHADILASELAAIVDAESAKAAQPKIDAARDAAGDVARAAAGDVARAAAWAVAGDAARAAARDAARDAAGDAAWDAARAAARAAAWAAAGDAARAAARDAARDAAGDAAWDAAWAAAKENLAPTVSELQQSARELVIRLCEVGR